MRKLLNISSVILVLFCFAVTYVSVTARKDIRILSIEDKTDMVSIEASETSLHIQLEELDFSDLDKFIIINGDYTVPAPDNYENITSESAKLHAAEKNKHERERIDQLLAELESGECITYYLNSGELVIE